MNVKKIRYIYSAENYAKTSALIKAKPFPELLAVIAL